MQEEVKGSEVNEKAAEAIKKEWDDFSSSYTQIHEYMTGQFVVALYHQTRAYQSLRHLDVGCGSGLGALILTSMMKNPTQQGHLLVTSDISPLMQEELVKRFKEAGFMANINNSFYTCSEEVGQEEKLTYSDYEKGIHVKSFIANNEKMPFASEEFNSYTANLSLQLVDNHMNQLREAYRVLRKDGIAGFTVWGKRESSTVFTFISKALAQAGIELPNPPLDSFHLGEDKQRLVEDAKKVGFKKAVTYYVTHYANYRDGEEAFEKLRNAPVFEHVPAEKMGLVKEKYIALFEEFQKENGGLAVNFDSLYLIAYK